MNPHIELIETTPANIAGQAKGLCDGGWRLVQMSATALPAQEGQEPDIEINYSFDKDYKLRNLRLVAKHGARVPSISPIFFSAFLYENEIREQFGIEPDGLVLDFKGTLYKTAVKQPFAIAAPHRAAPKPAGGAN